MDNSELHDYFSALRSSTQDTEASSESIKKDIIRKRWMLDAISFSNRVSPEIKTKVQSINDRIQDKNVDAESFVKMVDSLIREWDRFLLNKTKIKESIGIASWSSAISMASTLLAIFIGRAGLLTFLVSDESQEKVKNDWIIQEINPNPELFTISSLHVLMIVAILILIATPIAKLPKPTSNSTYTKKSLSQFMKAWIFIWASWLGLFIWLSISYRYDFKMKGIDWAIADVFNIASAFSFFYIFLIMDMPSVEHEDEPKRAQDFKRTLIVAGSVAFVILMVSVVDRLALPGFNLYGGGSTILSITVAVSMAYFFGRLDSHHLDAKRWMLAPLYLYVAIQVIWPSFGDNSNYATVVFGIALVLKFYLFAVVNFWIQNGHFTRYFDEAPKTYKIAETNY